MAAPSALLHEQLNQSGEERYRTSAVAELFVYGSRLG